MYCEITPASPIPALWIGAHARAADRAEFESASGRTAEQVVSEALACSDLAYVGWANKIPVCVFGVAPRSWVAGIGIPWMVGTDGLDRCAHALLRTSRPAIEVLHARFPELVNYIDARNVRAIRWLIWLGFTIHDPEPYGVAGLPFHRFTRDCRHV